MSQANPEPGPKFRCTAPLCNWNGPKEDTIQRAVVNRLHFFCPVCRHPARVAAMFVKPVKPRIRRPRTTPYGDSTVPEGFELAAFMAKPKTCSRCKQTATNEDFPKAKQRGKVRVRSWCKKCLAIYYQEHRKAGKAS